MNKKEIIAYLKNNKPIWQRKYGIDTLGLYGSFAKNEVHSSSDVDIFYERDGSVLKDGLEFWQLAEKIANDLQVEHVDLVRLSAMNPVVKYYAEKDFIHV